MDTFRERMRRNFYQVIAERGIGFNMDFLENERFFKTNFSCLSRLTETKIFNKKYLPLINVLALNSLHFF